VDPLLGALDRREHRLQPRAAGVVELDAVAFGEAQRAVADQRADRARSGHEPGPAERRAQTRSAAAAT